MSGQENKKVLVFDFDGTIVDSMGTFAKIASHVMPKYYDIDYAKAHRLYLTTSGIPFFQQLEVIFPGNPMNTKAAHEYETIKKESYFEQRVFEDAAPAIKALRQKNIKAVVSSNNFQDLVDRFVKKIGIEFDMVLGYRNNFAKGADHFKHIIKEIKCRPEEMTFVGDSLKDGERAGDFGIDFIAKEGIFTKEEFENHLPQVKVIKSLTELTEFSK